MNVPCTVLAAAAGAVLASATPGFSQIWTPTGAPNTNWSSIASSADGARLVASGGRLRAHPGGVGNDASPIWVSTNSGADWTITSAPIVPWQSVASAADGIKLVAVSAFGLSMTNGLICTSTNGGASWTSNAVPNVTFWTSVASSADGLKLVAAATDVGIYTSTNGGRNWKRRPAPPTNWTSVACSADGIRLVAADGGDLVHPIGGVYLSSNSGASWQLSAAPGAVWLSVASSADGSRLAAAANSTNFLQPGLIYLSTNSGLTWAISSASAQYWYAVASSADGRTMVAGSAGVFTSTDFGATWTSNSVPDLFWVAFASSADGARLGGVTDQRVFTAQLTPAPRLNLTPADGNLQLSWLAPSTDLVLQAKSALDAGNWTDAALQPTLNLTSLQYKATVAPTNNQEYYRLRSR